jgi:hypothetical protein
MRESRNFYLDYIRLFYMYSIKKTLIPDRLLSLLPETVCPVFYVENEMAKLY